MPRWMQNGRISLKKPTAQAPDILPYGTPLHLSFIVEANELRFIPRAEQCTTLRVSGKDGNRGCRTGDKTVLNGAASVAQSLWGLNGPSGRPDRAYAACPWVSDGREAPVLRLARGLLSRFRRVFSGFGHDSAAAPSSGA